MKFLELPGRGGRQQPRVACRALRLLTQFKADEEAVGNFNAGFLLDGKCIFNLGVGTAERFSGFIRSLF